MTKASDPLDEVQKIMAKAMFEIQRLTQSTPATADSFIPIIKLFIQGVISTAVDITSVNFPGAGAYLYADIESMAKQGGFRAIRQAQSRDGAPNYSVSNIAHDDMDTAMNYLGQELSTSLYKAFYELPDPLRTLEALLRGIEALLINLLDQKFDEPHKVLNSFCEHVHMGLDHLAEKKKTKLSLVK